jgi:hypothetical protein
MRPRSSSQSSIVKKISQHTMPETIPASFTRRWYRGMTQRALALEKTHKKQKTLGNLTHTPVLGAVELSPMEQKDPANSCLHEVHGGEALQQSVKTRFFSLSTSTRIQCICNNVG